ncbi:MAG TPA: hypothetical protein VJA27_02810 [Patescibacteria group bacterium]|nr:hypothetical protein [Patescibacteria group bacterium]
MSKRTKVRKCNVTFGKQLQDWLNVQSGHEVKGALGIQAALEFAKAVIWVCLTGRDFGHGGLSSVPESMVPMAIQPLYKVFLGGWGERNTLMEMVQHSTRVEIKINLYDHDRVYVVATFFEKAKTDLGRVDVTYRFATGECTGTTPGAYTGRLSEITRTQTSGR